MIGIGTPDTNRELIWDIDDSSERHQHPNPSAADVTTGVRSVASLRIGANPTRANDNQSAGGHDNKGNREGIRTTIPFSPPRDSKQPTITPSQRNTTPGVGPTPEAACNLISIEETNRGLISNITTDTEQRAQARANKISDVVRSSIASVFSFSRTIRQSFVAILLVAGLNTIAGSQGTQTPQVYANAPAPVRVEIAPAINPPAVEAGIAPTVTEVETPVTHTTFSKTIIVTNEHQPRIAFVQALTEFLTDNGTQAALPRGYHPRHNDAIRIFRQLEHGPQHEIATRLKHHTHTGDRFSFSLMSDGSIRLDTWQNRHSDDSKLPGPITFDLPAHL